MIESCVAAFSKEMEDRSYRVYVTNTLQLVCENLANAVHGKYIPQKWVDIINPKNAVQDEQSADEIIEKIIGGLRRLDGGGESM